ncbi:hypothetical protein [Pedobacter anseongensis]
MINQIQRSPFVRSKSALILNMTYNSLTAALN